MKVEYVTSTVGVGTELHISAAEYKRINSQEGWDDRQNFIFAIRSYMQANQSINKIISRDLEEAYRHIKKVGTIVLVTKTDGEIAWCEVYAATDGQIIPVITSKDGSSFDINYSNKTKRQMNQIRQEREADSHE